MDSKFQCIKFPINKRSFLIFETWPIWACTAYKFYRMASTLLLAKWQPLILFRKFIYCFLCSEVEFWHKLPRKFGFGWSRLFWNPLFHQWCNNPICCRAQREFETVDNPKFTRIVFARILLQLKFRALLIYREENWIIARRTLKGEWFE